MVKALKDIDIPLVVVGKKTKYFNKVNKEIKKNTVETHFLENVSMEELAAIYKLADIFIYPSLRSDTSRVVTEPIWTIFVTSRKWF